MNKGKPEQFFGWFSLLLWTTVELLMFQFMRGDDTCKRTEELAAIWVELKMINCGSPVIAGISSPRQKATGEL